MMKSILAWISALVGATALAAAPAQKAVEQAVIVHFTYGSTDLAPLFELEDRVEAAISAASVGEYDGHEVAIDGSDGYLYMYGPDADKLFAVVRPILEKAAFMRGAEVTKRYGAAEDGVRQDVLKLAL
jgi:hypothetical protein